MHFEWDEEKNRANIRKHGLDFNEAWKVFEGPMWVRPDSRFDYGETRLIGIGILDGRIVLIAFSEPDEDIIRIISMRKAKRNERTRLENKIKD